MGETGREAVGEIESFSAIVKFLFLLLFFFGWGMVNEKGVGSGS